MRIVFRDAANHYESNAYQKLVEASDLLWRSIVETCREPTEAAGAAVSQTLEREIGARLSRIDRRLRVDVDEPRSGLGSIAISTAGERRLRPLAETIVERAPKLERWTVTVQRPAEPFDRALGRVRETTGVDLSDARARAGFTRGHLLEVVVYAPGGASREAAELAVESLCGEAVVDDWIAAIDVEPMARSGPLRVVQPERETASTFPIGELGAAVRRAIEAVHEALPELPCHARVETAQWTMLEADPQRASDWPGQDDVALVTTMLPELAKSFLEGAPIASIRFSRHKETFCYLKIDGVGVPPVERLARRTALEDALNAALVPARSGAVVGNGLGIRYSYVMLALAALEPGVSQVSEIVRAFGVPKRSWLLFYDSALADEWVGIHRDAPAPP